MKTLITILTIFCIIGSPFNWGKYFDRINNRLDRDIRRFRQERDFYRKEQEKDLIPRVLPPTLPRR